MYVYSLLSERKQIPIVLFGVFILQRVTMGKGLSEKDRQPPSSLYGRDCENGLPQVEP